jgi:hypothetical protein
MLSRSTRAVLDIALRKYRPGQTDLIPVGGIDQLKPALGGGAAGRAGSHNGNVSQQKIGWALLPPYLDGDPFNFIE